MDENEAYERLVKSIESLDLSFAKIDFSRGVRFPMPSSYDPCISDPELRLTHRIKNSRAYEAVMTAGGMYSE
ncbi:MAG: hypothetical protein Q7S56_00540 [Nanoarchaeota archaeon]|nr:hypothetical protein [Nanoarchaeota archaeon]